MALTKASFRVSDLIPDLVLREKIKHQVLDVYKTFLVFNAGKNYSGLLKEIDTLDNYFYLGGHLNLIKEEHLKQLRNGFLVFKSHVILAISESNKTRVDSRPVPFSEGDPQAERAENLNARQKKIVEKFQNKKTLKLSELMDFFPDVSERTIRNELTSLIGLGRITRDGWGNSSFYKIMR